jgi:hypothetical protein
MSILQKYTIRHSCKNLVSVWLLKINSSSRLTIRFWQKTCWKPARASEQNGLTITRLLHTTLDLTGPPAASGVQDLSADFYNKITSLGFEHQRILSLCLYRHRKNFFLRELQFPILRFYAQSRSVFLGSERKNSTSKRVASDSRWAAPSKQRSAGKLTRNFQKKEKQVKGVQQVPSAHIFHMFQEEWTKKLYCISFSFIHPFMRPFFIHLWNYFSSMYDTSFHSYMIIVFIHIWD